MIKPETTEIDVYDRMTHVLTQSPEIARRQDVLPRLPDLDEGGKFAGKLARYDLPSPVEHHRLSATIIGLDPNAPDYDDLADGIGHVLHVERPDTLVRIASRSESHSAGHVAVWATTALNRSEPPAVLEYVSGALVPDTYTEAAATRIKALHMLDIEAFVRPDGNRLTSLDTMRFTQSETRYKAMMGVILGQPQIEA
jgi:hypothetical protein